MNKKERKQKGKSHDGHKNDQDLFKKCVFSLKQKKVHNYDYDYGYNQNNI